MNGIELKSPAFAGMRGAYAAMFTPYGQDGKVNEAMIEKLVEHGLSNGLVGFYLTGSTGEGLLLSLEERRLVMERAVKAVNGRAKLIAHVGCVATDDAVTLARHAAKIGIDWVSSVAPVYYGQNFNAAYRHYERISNATDLPFMIYSLKTAVVPERDVKFFDLPNVKGMKYTGTDYFAVQCLKHKPAARLQEGWSAYCDGDVDRVRAAGLRQHSAVAARSRHRACELRVTGFTAYFNSLSPDFRQLDVKRLVREAV